MDHAGAAQQQHALAQSMVTGARNPNSRTVRTDPSRRSYGSDGRLYKLIDKRDYGRYKVLTDDELLEESRKVGEMERDITDLSDSLHRRSPGRGRSQTRSPVQVGMAKKSVLQAQVARRKKEQAEMEEQRRQKEEDEEEERRLRALREEKSATSFELRPGGLDVPQSADERLGTTMHVVQQKYEQNLHVIDKLFEEKSAMERRIEDLEARLDGSGEYDPNQDPMYDTANSSGRPPALPQRSASPTSRSGSRPGQRPLSASWRSSSQSGSAGGSPGSKRSQSAGLARRSIGSRSTDKRESAEITPLEAAALLKQRRRSRDPGAPEPRASVDQLRRSNFELALQADTDKYLQRRRALEAKERKEKAAQLQWENAQHDRLRKAGKATEFYGLMARQEAAEQKATERALQKQKEREEEQKREREAIQRQRQARLAKPPPKSEMDWTEYQEVENAKRAKRREERAKQLQSQSQFPTGMAANLANRDDEDLAAAAAAAVALDNNRGFTASDPQKVIRSIERRRQQWDSRMQREALRREESRAARLLKSTGVKTATDRMLERNAQQEDAKRKQREERARAEADAKERSRARKAAADHKIKTASVPLASRNMTNAAQKRLEATRRRTEAEELSRLKEEKQQRARDKRLKDMSYVMSGVIKERERARKASVRDFVELSGSEERALEEARSAREAFRERLREIKRGVRKAQDARPTLIERTEQASRVVQARGEAIRVVGGAIADVLSSEMGDSGGADDLFDELLGEEEKLHYEAGKQR